MNGADFWWWGQAMNKIKKVIMILLGWRFGPSPRDNRWYWVLMNTKYIKEGLSHAFAQEDAANGWSNQDCWEDFDSEVFAYKLMTLPILLKDLNK